VNPGGVAFNENTTFYFSGQSYYDVIANPLDNHAYYILARQYIAALLNIAAGAERPAGVDLTAIHNFFNTPTNTPSAIGALSGSDPTRQMLIAWALTLDTYNNGRLNVNACGK
jgi:hypothetical protein